MRGSHLEIARETSNDTLLTMYGRPKKVKSGHCPLCLNFSRHLSKHLALHLEHIALFALPKPETMGDIRSAAPAHPPKDNKSIRSFGTSYSETETLVSGRILDHEIYDSVRLLKMDDSDSVTRTLQSREDEYFEEGQDDLRSDPASIASRRVDALTSLSSNNEGANQPQDELTDVRNCSVGLLENTEQILGRLRRADEDHIRQTFAYGVPISSARGRESAVIRVGIDFLPGSNRPEVARLEQDLYDKRPPDQRSAQWRVGTAQTLLSNFSINSDMSFSREDMSMQIVAHSMRRANERKSYKKYDRSNNSGRTSPSNSKENKKISRWTNEKKYIEIDSNNVRLVNDLSEGHWDVQATLIEVDEKALLDIMINCRNLIQKRGLEMNNSETKDLLETMIEDARRLFVRSPILSRMSTRRHIIDSKDT